MQPLSNVPCPMTVTPSHLFDLAVRRHREPWNWTLHFAALVGFALTLLLHSYLMLAASLILFGAGLFDLGMPDLPDNRWGRFVHDAVEWEKNWAVMPWTFRKTWRFAFVVVVALICTWALWVREPSALGLLIGFAYLVKIYRENRESGIDP